MRSVQTAASTHDQSRASASRLAPPGTADARACRRLSFTPPPSCLAFPRSGFVTRTSRGTAPQRYYAGSHSCPPRPDRQVFPLPPLRLPGIPPPTTSCAQPSLSQSPQRGRPALSRAPGFASASQARRYMPPKSVSYSCGLPVRVRLLPTPLATTRGDAVTFRFMRRDLHMARTPTLLTKRPHGTHEGGRPRPPFRARHAQVDVVPRRQPERPPSQSLKRLCLPVTFAC